MTDCFEIDEDILALASQLDADTTGKLCRSTVEVAGRIGLSDEQIQSLTGLTADLWDDFKNQIYPKTLDLNLACQLHGIIDTLGISLKVFHTGERVRTWLMCKNIAILPKNTTPYEAIVDHDDLESVHDLLVMGDPNRIDPRQQEATDHYHRCTE